MQAGAGQGGVRREAAGPPRNAVISSTTLAYVHPVLGFLVTGFAAYAGALGLRSRRPTRASAMLRARHRALAPWVYVGIVASFAGGLGSAYWLRDDLQGAASGHFQLG